MSKTLKKTLSIILAIVMIATTVPFAFAADTASGTFGVDNALTWILDNGLLTISGNGAMRGDTEIEIPWAEYKDSITDVVIEEGVTDVADYSFNDYSNLKTAYIADSVKTIYASAFRNCASMEKIFIGSGVEMMTVTCFWDTNCTVHYNGTSEMWNAIKQEYNGKPRSAVHYLVVASKEPTCADAGYENAYVCSSCDVTFGGTSIPATGEHTRVNDVCTVCGDGCTHPAWTNSVCDICGDLCVHPSYTESKCDVCKYVCNHINYENGICADCSYECEHYWSGYDCYICGLKGGELNSDIIWTLNTDTGVFRLNGTGDMPEYSYYRDIPWFNDLRGYIKTVIISEGITSLCADAFYWCSNLTSVTLPDTLNKIGGAAFCDCSALENIVIPSGVTTLDASTFAWCSALKTIHYLGTENALTIDETNNELADGILHFCEEKSEVSQTCAEDGVTAGWYCNTCEVYAVGGETISATGEHDWSNKDGVCANGCGTECQHDSHTDGVCDICGKNLVVVIDGVNYICKGDITNTGIFVQYDIIEDGCYKAGDGYVVFNDKGIDPDIGYSCSEVILYNATIDVRGTEIENATMISQEIVEVRFFGTNNLYSDSYSVCSSLGHNYYPTTFVGDDEAVLNLYGNVAADSMIVESGTINIYGISNEDDFDTVRLEDEIVIAEGAVVNIITGESGIGLNCSIAEDGITGAGTLNAIMLTVKETEDEAVLYEMIAYGDAVLGGNTFNPYVDFDLPYVITFNIPEGTSVTVPEGITLNLDSFNAVTIDGELIVNGTLICTHTGGEATCSEKAVCEICKQAYGDIEADNHDIVVDEAVAPKCGETGLTAGQHCSRCDAMTIIQEVVPALTHKDDDGDSLCDHGCGTQISDGSDGGTGEAETPDEPTEDTCDRCGEVHTDFFRNFICMIKDFFNRIISFLTSLFK